MEENFLNPVRKSEQLSAPDLSKDSSAEKNSGASSVGFFSKSEKKPTDGLSNGVRLTNAAYALLEFFPESDPLKNRAKDKVLAIMENLILVSETGLRLAEGSPEGGDWLSFKDYFSEDREKAKIQLVRDIDILLGYLEVGKSQKWLSGINFLIIYSQYEKIKEKIDLKPGLIQKLIVTGEEKSIKPVAEDGADIAEKPSELTARQGKILQFLSNNEKAQVMDLQTVLPNVTKRTIRRDLDELLRMGKIERMGEFNQVVYKILKKNVESNTPLPPSSASELRTGEKASDGQGPPSSPTAIGTMDGRSVE
ncbi:MAG: DeoR family transcriptional regulator [bacterium]